MKICLLKLPDKILNFDALLLRHVLSLLVLFSIYSHQPRLSETEHTRLFGLCMEFGVNYLDK